MNCTSIGLEHYDHIDKVPVAIGTPCNNNAGNSWYLGRSRRRNPRMVRFRSGRLRYGAGAPLAGEGDRLTSKFRGRCE